MKSLVAVVAFAAVLLLAAACGGAPAASKIAFTSDRDGNGDIYVMNADGSGQTRLTTNPAGDRSPSWSPAP